MLLIISFQAIGGGALSDKTVTTFNYCTSTFQIARTRTRTEMIRDSSGRPLASWENVEIFVKLRQRQNKSHDI